MSAPLSLMSAAFAVAVATGPFVQKIAVQNSTTGATVVTSFAAPTLSATAASGAVMMTVCLSCSTTGTATSVAVTDDKLNVWTVDRTTTDSTSDTIRIFIASCLTPTVGTQVVTITATGGTILAMGEMVEMPGVTGRGPGKTQNAAGSGQAPPLPVVNTAPNTSPRAICLHAFSVNKFSSALGLGATASGGAFVVLNVNQDFTSSTTAPGLTGYVLDTATGTDTITDVWTTAGTEATAQLNQTFYLV